MSDNRLRQEISVSGKSREIGVLVAIFRKRSIPFRQALTFAHSPVICVPLAYETQVRAILDETKAQYQFSILSPEEVQSLQSTFWVMLCGGLAILSLPWLRFLFHHHR